MSKISSPWQHVGNSDCCSHVPGSVVSVVAFSLKQNPTEWSHLHSLGSKRCCPRGDVASGLVHSLPEGDSPDGPDQMDICANILL